MYLSYTWTPELSALDLIVKSPKRGRRKSIGLFRKKPVDPECFFKFVRCLLAPAFWQNMLNNFSSRWEKRVVLDCQPTSYVKSDGIDFLVFVIYAVPQPPIHIAWYRRIVALINEFIHVYEVMAWLSTLGGAYSAMGDYCDRAKGVAKQISAKQLQLAARLGDPTQVCRCWIFLAMSAIQHGQLRLSRQILTYQWRFVHTTEGQRDPRLKNMILGVWSRLVYERKLRKLGATAGLVTGTHSHKA